MTRTRICFYVLLLTPLLVYWSTIFSEYGLRDDYSYIREAREEPGKLVKLTSSHGRPLYGALLETSFSAVDEVVSLQWIRLATVTLLTLLGLAIWRQLFQSGWSEIEAAVIGLGITLLPAAQITVGWAIGWPHVLALLLALAGFSAVEAELERGGMKRVIALIGGAMIYALAAFLYQSNALFAVVPIAAVLLVRSGREPATDRRWALIHLAILFAGMLGSFLTMKFLFSTGIFQESSRMQLETNPFTKLVWFVGQPLPNALALFALRDDFSTPVLVLFWTVVAGIAALIGYGYHQLQEKKGTSLKKKWYLCLVLAPFLCHAVSLAAAERSAAYRTLFALSSLVLMLLVYSLRSLLLNGRIHQSVYHAGLGLLVLAAAITAHLNTSNLIAVPQNHEWAMIHGAVMRGEFKKPNKVYVITPTVEDRTTNRVVGDEFGSLSSQADWVAKEMFLAALHERFPKKLPVGGSYTFASGPTVVNESDYDMIIDLRKLKQYRAP